MGVNEAIKLSQKIDELNGIVEQTYHFEQKVYELTKKIEANKAKISKEIGRKNRYEARVDDQTMFIVAKNVKTNIEFFEDQLQAKLDKKLYDQIVSKTVVIENLPGLVKFLKRYGVDPKEFKTYLKTIKEVDVNEVDQLIEIGELEIDQLQGCYKVDFEEDIKVKKSK